MATTVENLSYELLIDKSKKFQELKRDVKLGTRLSLTGISNLVVHYEDPCLVDMFLQTCFELSKLYKETYEIDAVELQKGAPGRGNAAAYIDALIFGSCDQQDTGQGLNVSAVKTDAQSGKRKRKTDGFVNRKEVLKGDFQDKLLIIKNIDYCMDFCQQKPGQIDARNLWIFDNFRNPSVRLGCRILLITNEPLKLPFKVRTFEMEPVDEFEATHIVDSFVQLYKDGGYKVEFNESQKKQISRKLCGLTYTESADAFSEALSNRTESNKVLNAMKVVKNLREKINRNLMEDANGLSHLTPKPWQDYICPENSNFTFDVKKILRDFNEIEILKEEEKDVLKSNGDNSKIARKMEAIRARMPHVIVLYGKGGVGKCLGRGTKVMMFNGDMKNAEDVIVGDLLMGPDSKSRTVLSTTSGIGPLYRVDQKNGDSYECNDAHVLSLQNANKSSDREPIFISAKDFCKKSKHWQKYNNGWKIGVEFEAQDLPIDAYWMGLWLGDGTSLKPAITVGHKDIEINTWLNKWAAEQKLFIRREASNGANAVNFSPRKGSGYCVNNVKKSLQDLGVLGDKHIPKMYWKNSSENRLKLLAGLLDSDGYMASSGSLQFTNVNKRLATDVLHLVRSLGLKGFWSESVKGIVRAYTVTIGGDLSRIPTNLPRKQGHDNPQKKSLKCGITVTPIGIGEYFGFAIDGDKQFLLGDFTVTHNSAFPIHFAGLLDFDAWDFNVNASHSKWIGEGAENMRKALGKISKASHVVVRVDEYDRAMGATDAAGQGMHEAHKQVEAEFMNWLQNGQEEALFAKNDIFVVLTTNHKENITGPLLRSGRADLVIDITEFDDKSMKETFMTAPRRMKNRGLMPPVGFESFDDMLKAINQLDLDKIVPLTSQKGFTVRDVDTLLIEMATHDYYFKQDKGGVPWNTSTFLKVMENSVGSTRGDSTSELILGDRFLSDNKEEKTENAQKEFDFAKAYTQKFDLDKFTDVNFFK
jgi:hypothetical protein